MSPLSYNTSIFSFYFMDIFLVPLILFWAADILEKKEVSISIYSVLLFLFIMWVGVSSSYSDYNLFIDRVLLWVRGLIIFVIIASTYGDVYNKVDILRLVLIILLIQSIIAIMQEMTQTPIGQLNQYFGEMEPVGSYPGYGRSVGTFQNPNVLSSWFIILIPILFDHIYRKRTLNFNKASLYIGTLLLSGLALVFTRSRGAIILLSIVLFSYIIYDRGKINYLLSSLLFAPLVFIFVISLRGGLTAFWSAISVRSNQMIYSLEIIHLNVIFGTGLGNYMAALENLTDEFWRIGRVHNMFLRKFAETGILGFALFSGFYFSVSKLILLRGGNPVKLDGYALSIIALLLSMFIYTSINTYTFFPISMFVLACGIATRK